MRDGFAQAVRFLRLWSTACHVEYGEDAAGIHADLHVRRPERRGLDTCARC